MSTEDLFTPSSSHVPDARHIVIEGEPGIGKTTLCRKLAFDWAMNDPAVVAPVTASATGSGLYNFRLVFLLEAHRLEEDSLLNCIYSTLLPEDFVVPREVLGRWLEQPHVQKHVLFVIDAYDELAQSEEHVDKLIERRIYSRSSLVVTTRPTFANTIITHFDSSYVILGYPFHKRKEFIHKYVEETKADIKIFRTLERSLQENDTVSDLSRNPLYLWFLCMLVEDNEGHLPETRTQLFEEVVELLLRKARMKLNLTDESCNKYFQSLCRLAFESHKLARVHFDEAMVHRFLGGEEAAMFGKLGFVSRELSASRLRPKLLYAFSHKTIQEFLAAHHLRSLPPTDRIRFVSRKRKDRLWWMVWIFLSGLLHGNDTALEAHFRKAICKDLSSSVTSSSSFVADDHTHNSYHLGLQCLVESGLFESFKSLASLIVPSAFVYHVMACHYCLQGFTVAHSEGPLEHQPDLVVNGLDLEMHQMFDYKLLDAINSCKNLQSIVFTEVLSANLLLEYLTKFLASSPKFKQLYIYVSPAVHPDLHGAGYSLQELRSAYKAVSTLRSLVFKGSWTSLYKGAESIAHGIEMLLVLLLSNIGLNLSTLVLNEHAMTDMTMSALFSRLPQCTQLRCIYLEHMRFPPGQFEALIEVLSEVGYVQHLHLIHCLAESPTGDSTAFPNNITKLLEKCQLKTLEFHSCDLKATHTADISVSLRAQQHLTCFELQNNQMSFESMNLLFSALSALCGLERLTLCSIHLVPSSVSPLSTVLQGLHKLEKLNLSANHLGSTEAFGGLLETISNLGRLSTLELNNCGITDTNLQHLHQMFRKGRIKDVSLIGNMLGTTEEGVQELLRTFEGSTCLESLSVTCVRFSVKTGLALADALAGNASLLQLNVLSQPTPELMSSDSFRSLYKDICSKLPSLHSFSRGFNTNVAQAHLWRKNDHSFYRGVCLGW